MIEANLVGSRESSPHHTLGDDEWDNVIRVKNGWEVQLVGMNMKDEKIMPIARFEFIGDDDLSIRKHRNASSRQIGDLRWLTTLSKPKSHHVQIVLLLHFQ